MMDELFDRNFQAGRADLNDGIDRAVRALTGEFAKGLERLNSLAWRAPWDNRIGRVRKA